MAKGLIADSGFRADVAQLVEHSLGKGEVTSSILVIGSRFRLVRQSRGEVRLYPYRSKRNWDAALAAAVELTADS